MEQTQQGPTVDSNLVIDQYQQQLVSTTDDLMRAKAYIRSLEHTIVRQNQLVVNQDQKIEELEAKLQEKQPKEANEQEITNQTDNVLTDKETVSPSSEG